MRLRGLKSIQFSDQLIEALIGGEIFFLRISQVGYQKNRLFE
jgi:hypothetical protein